MDLPVNILGAIPVGLFVIAVGVWLLLSEAAAQTSLAATQKRALRIGLVLVLAVWFAAALTITWRGLFIGEGLLPGIGLGIALAIPVTLGLIAFSRSATLRTVVDAVPVHWLIGFQFGRNLGFIFLALADVGLLPVVFANRAGYGDVLVGLFAPLVALWYLRRLPYARPVAVLWNLLGLLDFVVALVTALAAVEAFPSSVVLSQIQLIPTFGVPLFILLHLATLRQLLRQEQRESRPLVRAVSPY